MSRVRVSHIGICVTDLERSRRFYCEGLGFHERSSLEASGPATERLLSLPGAALSALYLERDGVTIELLRFDAPGSVGDGAPRPMNQLGLTHVSMRVADLDATLAGLRSTGAVVLEETRIESPEFRARAIFITDPDGTRIELVQSPGPLDQLPG